MSEWIAVTERLPDAGEFVIAFVREDRLTRRIRAFYAPRFKVQQSGDTDWTDYCEAEDAFYLPEGWYEANEYEETHWHVSDGTVSHWMPLPEPPK